MANERKTESLVRDWLRAQGYFDDDRVRIEEQKSDNPRIAKLLKQASKKGSGVGQPEFIISTAQYPDLVIVIECKADVSRHRSPDFSQPVAYACDGALHYASYLCKEFDVIAIGVSGETAQEVLVSHFLCLRAAFAVNAFVGDKILAIKDYYQAYITSPEKFNQDYEALLSYSQDLNERLHKLKVKESQRSLLLSGILISLQNRAFRIGYASSRNAEELSSNLVNTIVNELKHDGIDRARIQNLRNAYAWISTHTILSRDMRELVDLISEVDDRVNGFMRTHEYFDTIGQFYIEFFALRQQRQRPGYRSHPSSYYRTLCRLGPGKRPECRLG
ncbi:MAG TPA: hypothetical protein VNH53_02430 [Sphingomicrobium sp.]|jgi:type I restriction enzyme M protein|nr:hypothetical protein [Sphingomicrobium sp.]